LPITLPPDFDLIQGIATVMLFVTWFSYSTTLRMLARGSLNERLSVVRVQWFRNSLTRGQKPFDAILLGHIVNSIAFFGSATLIVLAGIATLFASARTIYETVSGLALAGPSSFELFIVHLSTVGVILTLGFFSFTYALRKLIYVLALIGAMPENPPPDEDPARREGMVEAAATVLSEALKTFNFGIRAYYYSVAALGLFVSPWLCIALTVIATGALFYRQTGTRTAGAIGRYVDLSQSRGDHT
jgi:uncharacterized membrane protein